MAMRLRLPFIKFRPGERPQISRSLVAARLMVEAAGGKWLGMAERLSDEPLALFNDGVGEILSLPLSEISLAAVRDKLANAKITKGQLSQSDVNYYAGFKGDPDFMVDHPDANFI